MACYYYKVDLIGGDTCSSTFGMVISMTWDYGKVLNLLIFLVVYGDLGAAYLGLQILKREYEVFQINPHIQP